MSSEISSVATTVIKRKNKVTKKEYPTINSTREIGINSITEVTSEFKPKLKEVTIKKYEILLHTTVLNQCIDELVIFNELEDDCKKLYNEKYLTILYNILCEIKSSNIDTVFDNIKNNLTEWRHPQFAALDAKLQENDDIPFTNLEVNDGLYKCNVCGSEKTYSYQKQTRSADEPMTTFITCANKQCGKKWRV